MHLHKNRFLLFSLLIALLLVSLPGAGTSAQGGEWPRTLTDATGTAVTLDAPPQRIASITLASDEILLSLVGPERLVGVSSLAPDPGISNVAAAAASVPVVATDPELLVSINPDLVIIATWTDPAVADQLREAGLTVFAMPAPVGLNAINEAITLVGQLVGEEDAAAALIGSAAGRIHSISAAVAGQDAVRTLYLTPGNYTSGSPSTIAEVIAAAGGIDITVDAGLSQFEPLSDEFILEQNPDVILLSGWTPWDPTFVDMFANSDVYAGLSAVQNGRVYPVNDAHLTTTSQYIVEGVADVAALLHPESYTVYPLTVTDALGREVTLNNRPERIASLTLGTDEVLAALLANEPERLVGLTYLVDDASVSNLAGTDTLAALTDTRIEADPEQLIGLDPDLIFAATYTDSAVLSQLEDAGIPVITVGNFTSVAAMLDNVAWVGEITGNRAESLVLFGNLTDRLEAVASAMIEEPVSAIYLSTDNWVAGCATTLDDIITHAGGINAACTAGLDDWNQIDNETLLTLDPDVIVFSSWVDVDAWLADDAIQALAAVQNETAVRGNDAHLSAVSQYIVDGVEDMAAILYPAQ